MLMMFQSCQKAVLHAAGRAPSSSQLKLSKCSVFGRTSQLMQRPNGAPAREFRPAPVQMGRRSSKIALRKGKADAAKAKLYGKFGKMVRAAVLAGGPDPAGNPRLKDVLHQAKQAGAPNDIIERNLKSKDTKDFTEVTYEAYGPGGTGFIMECLTDNLNRTAADVRTAVTKAGGHMADRGSVLFNFSRAGVVLVDAAPGEEAVLEAAMEAGATDVLPDEDEAGTVLAFKVVSAAEDYAAVAAGLVAQGLAPQQHSGLAWLPLAPVEDLSDEVFEANEAMMERLLAVDDVDAVYSTCAGLE